MWQIGWEGLCDKDSVLVDERECISVRAKRERERERERFYVTSLLSCIIEITRRKILHKNNPSSPFFSFIRVLLLNPSFDLQ